jgi:hypothetical protein
MKPPFWRAERHCQQGSVSVEAAVCIALILVPLLSFMFAFGKFFWHYTVVQKAIHDAALYMAKAPLDEVRGGAALGMANYIIRAETAELDSRTRLEPWLQCGYRVSSSSYVMRFGACEGGALPFAVQTNTFMTIPNPLSLATNGSGDITFLLSATMRHAGK